MATGERPVVNPLALWGTILTAARLGNDTQQLYARISTQIEETGVRYGPGTMPSVGHLWSQAKAMVNAGRELGRAPSEYAITSSMIGVLPYGKTAMGITGMPRYQARINFTVGVSGQTESRSYVIKDIDPAAMTVGELRAQAASYAADAAGGSPIEGQTPELVGVDEIFIEQF